MNIGKNIQYYRMRKGVSQQWLADAIGASKSYITRLEKAKVISDVNLVKKICAALDVSLGQFMTTNCSVSITSASFRSPERLSPAQQQPILVQLEYAAQRHYDSCQCLDIACGGCDILDNRTRMYEDFQQAAVYLREVLGIGPTGPVGSLIHLLESKDICVALIEPNRLDEAAEQVTCCHAMTDKGFPVLALNSGLSLCEQRFAIAKELARIIFEGATKKQVKDIAGRFLLPTEDLKRELGAKCTRISLKEIAYVQKQYGIQAHLIVLRAAEERILPQNQYYAFLEAHGGLPDNTPAEKPARLEQLVCRAYAENMISLSKAAELLSCDVNKAAGVCGDEE